MATTSITVHLESSDQPAIMALDLPHRPFVLHLQGKHQGPSLIGSVEALRRIHDALGTFLAAEDPHAEAEAA